MIQGGCKCGAVRYTLDAPKLPAVYACHCRDCQTWSGSAFALATFIPESTLKATGPIAIYEFATPSGRVSTQRICSVCHTRIFNTNSARPGFAALRAGTLDRSDELNCVAHIWVSRKQPWLQLAPGTPVWAENAPPSELMALTSKASS